MKTNNEDLGINTNGKKTMTRKEAISKAGFMAISAATTMMLLSVPKAAHASSAPAAPVDEPTVGSWKKRT
jgi:hypothetical protein